MPRPSRIRAGRTTTTGTWTRRRGIAIYAGGNRMYLTPPAANGNLAFQALSPAGGSLPHNNMMPTLTLYFIIALQGVFPPRG